MAGPVNSTDFISQILDTPTTDDLPVPAGERLRITIRRHVLQLLLDKAATVVPTHDVRPVLKNFLIQVDIDRLRVIATDLELSMIATTPLVTVHTPGICVLPAKKMTAIIREASGDDVALAVIGTTAHITIGRASWSLKLAGGDDYPPMPPVADIAFTSVERSALLGALSAVKYAASRDPNRASLNMVDIKNGRLIATDGSRFQQALLAWFPVDLRIPIAAVDDLLRLLKLSELELVDVGQSDNHLIFRFATDVFIVNKLVAQFPDMEQILLKPALENRHDLQLDKAELLAAVKRVRINADTESSAIALIIDGATLTVRARDKYGNTAQEAIEVTWTGAPRTIVVNHGFLADMFKGYTGETATFRLGDDTKTRKSMLLLTDEAVGSIGVVQQMNADWVGL
jgi:DNA polymerase-3 subunit beta